MKGFTLLEIILSLAIITIIVTITPPSYEKLYSNMAFRSTIDSYISSLYRAQKLSQSGKLDSAWGVKIQNDKIIIFKGNSFDGRDVNYDENFDLLSNIIVSGDTEINFSKIYGFLPYETNTVIKDNSSNEKTITINKKGLIQN